MSVESMVLNLSLSVIASRMAEWMNERRWRQLGERRNGREQCVQPNDATLREAERLHSVSVVEWCVNGSVCGMGSLGVE